MDQYSSVNGWRYNYLEGLIRHKHQETVFIKDTSMVEGKLLTAGLEFSYVVAKDFLKSTNWEDMPWRIDPDAVKNAKERQHIVSDMAHFIAEFHLSDKDKTSIKKILKDFIDSVDDKWRYRSNKRC